MVVPVLVALGRGTPRSCRKLFLRMLYKWEAEAANGGLLTGLHVRSQSRGSGTLMRSPLCFVVKRGRWRT